MKTQYLQSIPHRYVIFLIAFGCSFTGFAEAANCQGDSCYYYNEDNDTCDNYQETPFLWGDDDEMEEREFSSSYPGKREDSFFDSLTR